MVSSKVIFELCASFEKMADAFRKLGEAWRLAAEEMKRDSSTSTAPHGGYVAKASRTIWPTFKSRSGGWIRTSRLSGGVQHDN